MRFITVAFVAALILALAIPAVIAIRVFTGGGLGDPSYSLWVRNDSDNVLYVQYLTEYPAGFGYEPGPGEGFAVPSHRSGATLQGASSDPWSGRVRVVSLDCTVLWEQRLSSHSGGLVIAADRTARWSEDRSELPDPVYPSAGGPPADDGIRPEGQCRPYGPIEWDAQPYMGS
jgi:hypothetical protein